MKGKNEFRKLVKKLLKINRYQRRKQLMSTKIYNAYVFDKNYSMYELEQLLDPVKEKIKKWQKK